MFILTFALALLQPAEACAMPRMQEIAVAPTAPVANAKPDPNVARTLEQALADIDGLGIPEAQAVVPVAPVQAPAPAAKNRAAAADDAPPLGSAPPQS